MNPTATAAAPDQGAGRARRRARSTEPVPYDFRRPIQLSREHSRILQLGFDSFARQATTLFTSSLRTVCEVSLRSIDQRTYAEYIDSLEPTTYMTMLSVDPMPGVGVIELSLLASMSCVDHMLGGPGTELQPVRPLSDIEGTIINGLVDRLLGEMRYALAGIVALDPKVIGKEYSPQFAQVAGAADVMVVTEFRLKIGERSHRLTVCLPFGGLLPHLSQAAAPSPASDRERAQRAQAAQLLRNRFDEVPVEVSVRLRSTELTPDQLTTLTAGDVVRLTHPSSAPIDVTVDAEVFAHATIGARGTRMAALIVGTPQEES